jgi:APA family basic amino acid/polyamine antiporter
MDGGGALRREVGLPGAVLLGLGAMVGTGVFVSIGLAAGVAGPALLAATLLAALVATANGLSSAQLAAAHPVSGGTYEYGYRWLSPAFGFAAGWLFLLAKSASAATAAMGLAGYLLELLGLGGDGARVPRTAIGIAAALGITAFVAGGIRRSNRGNAVIVTVTLAGLAALVVTAIPAIVPERLANFTPFLPRGSAGEGGAAEDGAAVGMGDAGAAGGVGALLHGAALMFVAFTGYGRIATLGEEVRDPERVIPRAVILTMAIVTALYLGVGFAGVGVLGAAAFGDAAERTAAPLEAVAVALGSPALAGLVSVAAVTAMAGVLLNLVLGLSRVLLAMARRGDAPAYLSRIDEARASPVASVWTCGALVAAVALTGNVRIAWSFSAFTVLVYYAITNLAALRLPAEQRRFPRWIPAAGLVGCLTLAFWVEPGVWLAGSALLALGLGVRAVVRRGRAG